MKRLIKKLILPLAAALTLSSASYAKDDIGIFDFKARGVQSEETSVLQTEIPNLLNSRLENVLEVLEIPEFNARAKSFGVDESDPKKLKENFQGLDYILTGDYTRIGNNISVNSRVTNLEDFTVKAQHAEGSIDSIFKVLDELADEIKTDIGYAQKKPEIDEKAPVVKPQKETQIRYTGISTILALPHKNKEFKEFYRKSFLIGIETGTKTSKNIIVTFPIIRYKVFQPKWDSVLEEIGLTYEDFDLLKGGSISILNLSGGAAYLINPQENMSPFIEGNIGFYRRKTNKINITVNGETEEIFEGDTEYAAGAEACVGLENRVTNHVSLKGRVSYERIFLDEKMDIISAGLTLSYLRK